MLPISIWRFIELNAAEAQELNLVIALRMISALLAMIGVEIDFGV